MPLCNVKKKLNIELRSTRKIFQRVFLKYIKLQVLEKSFQVMVFILKPQDSS